MSHASISSPHKLAYQLLRIRRIEEAIANRYQEQKMRCPVHLSIGQEAIAVGVCDQLSVRDYVISSHRAHAHYLAKGGCLKKLIAEIYGKSTGCGGGRGGSMHLVDMGVGFMGSTPIVGGSIPIGVGLAFASKLKNEERIVCIFFGEGATEEGVFAESLNFAALKHLPVLFICENNFYSVYSHLSVRQHPLRSRTMLAEANGLFAMKGEGNSLEEVSFLTTQAILRIQKSKGPIYLEFTTYRYREHCGPDVDPFRTCEEATHWLSKDPLNFIEKDSEWETWIQKEIEEAFDFAEKSPFPSCQSETV
jgi:TPP-dependent pyruvate/acetoin dehydrogenase alpha subunit